MTNLIRWIGAGLLATGAMDLGSALIRKLGLIRGLTPQLIGRWFAYLARGETAHGSILLTPPARGELPFAGIGHYLIGISLAVIFGAAFSALLGQREQVSVGLGLAMAMLFGLVSCVLPWLVMFPSMGFGPFGVDAPAELLLLRTSLVNHLIFGAALGLFARVLGAMR